MRNNPTEKIEDSRITKGVMASDRSIGANGAFILEYSELSLMVVASDGSHWEQLGLPAPPWEHVSVSASSRCPTWDEMCYVKSIFWRDDETVIQFHVPHADHVNWHPFCLHLWKPIGLDIPRPPTITVGPIEDTGGE